MSNIKSITASVMLSILFVLGFSSAQATVTKAQANLDRSVNAKCLGCHQDDHKKTGYPNTHRPERIKQIFGIDMTCQMCHVEIDPVEHRRTQPKVKKYAQSQAVEGTEKDVVSLDEIVEKNQACLNCHKPGSKYMRKGTWTHDVHFNKITCSNCHELHLEKDAPVKGIIGQTATEQVQMCVQCHSDMTNHKTSKGKED